MTYAASRGLSRIARTQARAAREAKRPNGHKVQLALRREIEALHRELERQRRANDSAASRILALENKLLAVSADRDGWRALCGRNSKFIAELECMLELAAKQRSWEERRQQLTQAIEALKARGAAPDFKPGDQTLALTRYPRLAPPISASRN